MEVSVNHLLLQMESNSFMLSCMRFWKRSVMIEKLKMLHSNSTPEGAVSLRWLCVEAAVVNTSLTWIFININYALVSVGNTKDTSLN